MVAVNVRERYLKRQTECVVSLFSQEGEGRDAGTDGARTRVFVCARSISFSFFLAGIKYQQTLLVLQIQPSERRAQQQARQ